MRTLSIQKIAMRFLMISMASLFLASCSSAPALKNIGKNAPEHPINTPEQAKLIKEQYSK